MIIKQFDILMSPEGDSGGGTDVNPARILSGEDSDFSQTAADLDNMLAEQKGKKDSTEKGSSDEPESEEEDHLKEDSTQKKETPSLVDVFKEQTDQKKEEKDEEEEGDGEGIEEEEELDEKALPNSALGNKVKKFYRLSKDRGQEIETLKKDLEEARSNQQVGDIKESEEYKQLVDQLQKTETVLGRVSLENSPDFINTYDKPVKGLNTKAEKFLLTLKAKDPDKAQKAAEIMDSLQAVPPGDEHDPNYYAMLDDLGDLFSRSVGGKVVGIFDQRREKVNERFNALSEAEDTDNAFVALRAEKMQQLKDTLSQSTEKIIGLYEDSNDALVKRMKENEEIFGYSRITGQMDGLLRSEVDASAEQGYPTPNLIALAVNGGRYPVMQLTIQKLYSNAAELAEENKSLKERLDKITNGGSAGGRASASSSSSKGKKSPESFKSGSGILETLSEAREEGTI